MNQILTASPKSSQALLLLSSSSWSHMFKRGSVLKIKLPRHFYATTFGPNLYCSRTYFLKPVSKSNWSNYFFTGQLRVSSSFFPALFLFLRSCQGLTLRLPSTVYLNLRPCCISSHCALVPIVPILLKTYNA